MGPLVPRDPEPGLPNPGDRIDSVVARFGPPRERNSGTMVTELVFDGFTVITASSGRVVGVVPD